MRIDKSAGVQVAALSDIFIEDSLNLEGGILETGPSNYIIIGKTESGMIRGFSQSGTATDDRYIWGNIRQYISPILPNTVFRWGLLLQDLAINCFAYGPFHWVQLPM